MLYHLLYPLRTTVSVFNVTGYTTFRTAAASLTALAISLALGPWLIKTLREFQVGQVIRHEGPATHAPKAGTPTMGGLLILTGALVPTLLWADLTNVYIWIAVVATAAFGAIGFTDDYLKIVRRSHHGLLPRYKMLYQVLIAPQLGYSRPEAETILQLLHSPFAPDQPETYETLTAYLISPAYRTIPALLLLVVVMYLRPQGLFGRR